MKKKITFIITIITIIALIITLGINFNTRLNQLEGHHNSRYPEYSYAYDCLIEAEIQYHKVKADLVESVQNYIDSIAPTSNLRGYALIEECEKANVDIIFVLAQAEIESHFGTKGLGSKLNNVFNVGVFDGLKASEINKKYKFNYPNQSIEPYLKLLNERYLINKLESDLLVKFVDINDKRYASNPNYEAILTSKYNSICKNTKIKELEALLRSYAIKCNR